MKTVAMPGCYGCLGTGKIVGFGLSGCQCLCVAECLECGTDIAWEHDDQHPPKLCEACYAADASDDNSTD